MKAVSHATQPLVTIAIPTFNRAAWLPRCIHSAIAQSHANIEILVADNGSTDSTASVLSNFRDPRIRIIRHRTNIGLVPNWNSCIEAAKGDFIVFVSDDDIIDPSFLQRAIALTKQKPEVPIVMALSNVYFIELDRTQPAAIHPRLTTGLCAGVDILEALLGEEISAPMCTTLIRTNHLRGLGGFRKDFPMDSDTIACSSLLLGGIAGFINEALGTVSSHGNNETSRLTFETKFSCHQRYVALLEEMTIATPLDSARQRSVAREGHRMFARFIIRGLASARRHGMTLSEVCGFLWQTRRYLRSLTPASVVRLARPISILVLPPVVTRSIRHLLQPRRIARQSTT